MDKNNQQEEQVLNYLINNLEQHLYPEYPLGCESCDLQKYYEPLESLLKSIDISQDQSLRNKLTQQKLTKILIRKINEACKYAHRIEITQIILNMLKKLTNRLHSLPIARDSVSISEWQNQLHISKLSKAHQIETKKHYHQLLKYFDQMYQYHHFIANIDLLLLNYPQAIIAKHEFQKKLLQYQQSCLTLPQKLYIGVMVSSTVGCRYLWNLMVAQFINSGGELSWIEQGISCKAIPQYLRTLSQLSWIMAYHFNKFTHENAFQRLIYNTNQMVENVTLLEGLYIIAYFQALACLCLVCGLIPENQQYISKYLTLKKQMKPSTQSFEAMEFKEVKDQVIENQKATELMINYFLAEEKQQDEQQEELRNRKLSYEKVQIGNGIEQKEKLQEFIEHQSPFQKLKNMSTVNRLKEIYGKFAYFNEGGLLGNWIVNQQNKRNFEKKPPSTKITIPESQSSNIVYASDWMFEHQGIQQLNNHFNNGLSASLKKFLHLLRNPSSHIKNQHQAKVTKIYYQMLNNYIYESVNYEQLVKGINQKEKNFIKLVTKSPFLFNQLSFEKMKASLKMSNKEILEKITEIISYKLQTNVNIISLMYSRYHSTE